jgi:hypothetical protein
MTKYLLKSMSHICLRCDGSSPELGSSKKTTLGFPMSAIAKDNLLLIPPDSYLLLRSLSLIRSTSMSKLLILFYRSVEFTPFNIP